jgi:hypothetical protein
MLFCVRSFFKVKYCVLNPGIRIRIRVFENARYGSGSGSATRLVEVVAHLGELLLVGGVLADLEHALDLVLECEVERLLGEVSDDAGYVAAPEAPHALVPATSPIINNKKKIEEKKCQHKKEYQKGVWLERS